MAKDEARIKFTADTQEFTAGIAKANSSLTKIRSELKLNATEMKGAGDSVELLTQRQELLAQESEASRAKIDALSSKLEAAKRIFGENSTEADKWATQLANARNAEAKIQQEIEQTNAALAKQESASRETETALSKLESTIDSQEAEVRKLADEYKNAVVEFGLASKEAKDLEKKLSGANKELKDSKSDMNKAEQAARELADGLEKVGTEANESKGSVAEIAEGTVIGNFATDALQLAIDKIVELGTEGERAIGKLEATTGANAETMTKYKGVMEEIYAGNYGESFDEVATSMATVVQIMGDLPDNELQTVTQNALTLASKFDMDVTESVRAANSMMDQFGITSEEAYNLIVQGAQNGLNQNGDLLDTVNEYGTQFAAAGYSADDMFNMLKNGAESGTWSIDKLGDAVKEYNIRMTDGTANEALEQLGLDADKVTAKYAKGGESAKQATQQVVGALMEVEDEQERYKLGQEIMGTMWEDLGEDAVQALMNTEGSIESANDAMKQADSAAYDNIGDKVSEIGRRFETDIVGPIKDAVMPALEGFADFFIDNFSWLAPIVTGLAVAFGVLGAAMAIQGVIKGVSSAFAILNGIMSMNPVFLVVAAIAGLVAAFVLLWNNCEGFRNFWKGLWEKLTSAAKSAYNGIKNVIKNVVDKFKEMKDKASNIFQQLKSKATSIFNAVRNAISRPVNAAKNIVSTAVNGIRNTFSKIASVKNTVVSVFNGIQSAISSKINAAKNAVGNAIDRIKGMFNFSWSLPKIRLPHFTVTGGKAPWGFGGEGSLPSVSVSWYARGGIMTQPTIFGMAGSTLLGGGEAGPEAILPIDVLQRYIDNAFQRNIGQYATEGGGDVYNFYVNDAVVNGTEEMRAVAKDFLETLARNGGM